MKDDITSSHSYTLQGGEEAVEILADRLSNTTQEDEAEMPRGFVVLRSIREKLRVDILLHKFKAKAEERRKRPKPPTVRKARDL